MRYLENQEQDFGVMPNEMGTAKPKKPKKPGAVPGGTDPKMAQPAAPQTFAQMREAGYARPPMPMPGRIARPPMGPRAAPVPTATLAPRRLDETFAPPPGAAPGVAPVGPGGMVTHQASDFGIGTPATPPAGGAPTPSGSPDFDPMDWLRQQITGGAQGEMGRAYDYLGGRIDDDYDMRQKSLEEEMANRGLADSVGEGMYSGRTTDLNVGRRSAKEDLAERLGGNSFSNSMSALQQMLGLGQQGFENDMNYNQWLMQMLGLGYGG